MPAACKIVVPCYNEAERLRLETFRAFVAREPGVDFLFVNDGSSDATLARLRELERSAPERFAVLDLPENRGKAEAVRACGAASSRPRTRGYWDADLAARRDPASPRCERAARGAGVRRTSSCSGGAQAPAAPPGMISTVVWPGCARPSTTPAGR
jgi:hypothetical protein